MNKDSGDVDMPPAARRLRAEVARRGVPAAQAALDRANREGAMRDERVDEQQGSGEELQAIDEEEDVVCPPCLPTPYQPTLSEYLDHCVTHYPYRAWCRHCLEGRGRVWA